MAMIITSKDVRLPLQLQRAMAAEAEAAREARAKVIYSYLHLFNTFHNLDLRVKMYDWLDIQTYTL